MQTSLNKPWYLCSLLLCLIATQSPADTTPLAAETSNTDTQALVTHFWQATTANEQALASAALQEATNGDIARLYNEIKAGPAYRSNVPRGIIETAQKDHRGKRYPYVVVIPDHYDPKTAYPIDFNLHGGIGNKPRWRRGGKWWGNGKRYEKYRSLNRITVFPAAWSGALWWEAAQAENISEILRSLKQTYHIDDNRAFLSGLSDGGTGTFFFAFKHPTDWAAFMPYIGHPSVLSNPHAGGKHTLSFENLMNSSLYIVNGEKDRLYPTAAILPFIEALKIYEIRHQFTSIKNGGHNMDWFSDQKADITHFKNTQQRDPLPEKLRWELEPNTPYHQIKWLRIDTLTNPKQSGWLSVARQGNTFYASTENIDTFTIMLNPEEVDFNQNIRVQVNDHEVFDGKVTQDINTLLRSANRRDKTLLFTGELVVKLPLR